MFDRLLCSKLRGVNGRANGGAPRGPDVIVFGQIARDLVLVVETMPGARQATDVYQRRELLGGKGANQAVALAIEGIGNLVAWADDHVLLPLTDTQVIDTTGAGDAFTAGLIMALAQGGGPQRAARLAVAAAGATVGHPGGRPALTPKAVQNQLSLIAEGTRQ
jgi:sugar/nucleoside kinase (ribokinase family)